MVETPTRNLTLIRVLAAVSGLISMYLLVTSLQRGHVAGCGPASSCHDVVSSHWGHWLGLPVSAPASLLYAAIFLATFWATPRVPAPIRQKALAFLWAAGWVVLAAAIWFVGLQLFVLRHVCPYCLVAHAAAACAAVLILRRAPRPARAAVVVAPALGVAALLLGQWVNRPATHEVLTGSAPALSATTPGKARYLEIFGGMFRINVDEVPLIGARDAPAVMIALLDYTCRHCRQMHGVLLEAERAHRGKLAIASLPMPLDASCNKLLPQTAPQHESACQYARLGLAVWRADPTKMDRFNDWVFEPPQPPGLPSVLGYAQQIVGEEALGRAMNDPWVETQLAQDIAIYEATYKRFGKGSMPQLIIGDNIVFGELENGMQDLETLLLDILK